MVFGWGKKKDESKQEDAPSKNIRLSDISKMIDGLLSKRTRQLVTDTASNRNKSIPLLKDLLGIIKELERDDLNVDDIDKNLRIIVLRGKKQVIDIIKKDVNPDLPQISSLDDVKTFVSYQSALLKKIGDVLGRQTRVIHIFAKKYAERLKEILKLLNEIHQDTIQLVNNFEKSKSYHDSIASNLAIIHDSANTVMEKTQRLGELRNLLSTLRQQFDSTKESIAKIKNSAQFLKYLEVQKKLEMLNNDKMKIKSDIDMQFAKISRPLGRYVHTSSLDKSQKPILDGLVNDPISVLSNENKDNIIIILENIRKGILSDSISVKDTDKSMVYLTETEEMMDSMINQISQLQDKKLKLEQELEYFDQQSLHQMETLLEKTRSDIDNAETKINEFEQYISSNKQDMSEKITKIESDLAKFSNTLYIISNHEANN